MSNTAPPGWYPSGNSGELRYWDGSNWTEHTAPEQQPAVSSPQPIPDAPSVSSERNWFVRHKVLTGVLGVILLIVIAGALGGGGGGEDPAVSDASNQVVDELDTDESAEPEPVDTDGDGVMDPDDVDPSDPKLRTQDDIDSDKDGVPDYKDDFPKNPKFSKDSDGDRVADSEDAFPKDPEFSKDSDGDRVADSVDAFPKDPNRSEITLAMENALSAAQDYLDYSAFSRQGLIDQLSSEYGSGYNVADATWAVDNVGANWNEQAVRAAKQYLEFTSFSRQGLIDQLSSSAGSQFTVEQATYAVNKIGL